MNYQRRYTIGKVLRKKNKVYQTDSKAKRRNFPVEYRIQCYQKGINFHRVYLAEFQLKNGLPYRGLRAKRRIKSNSLLMSIPRELLISTRTAYFTNLKNIFDQHSHFFLDHDDWEEHILMAFLINEKRKRLKSKYYLYIQQLPNDIDLPIFWNDDQLTLLQDKNLVQKVQQKKQEYLKTQDIFKQILQVEEEEFKWAYTNLYTRDFGSGLKYKCLIPFCEYFNHECVDVHILLSPKEKSSVEFKQKFYDKEDLESVESSSGTDESFDLDQSISDLENCIADQFLDWLPANTNETIKEYLGEQIQNIIGCHFNNQQKTTDTETIPSTQTQQSIKDWEEDDFDHFIIKCQKTEQFQMDAQVYFNYGRLSNRELLLRYGIAIENNKYDHVYLQINPREYLQQDSYYFKKQSLSIKLKYTSFPLELIKFCKAINEKNNNSVQWDIDAVLQQTNPEKEVDGLKLALKLLKDFKSEFKENLEQEDQLLSNQELTYTEYFALVYRLEKQKIINHNIKLIMLAIIIVQDRQQEKYVQSIETNHEFQTNRILLQNYLKSIKE